MKAVTEFAFMNNSFVLINVANGDAQSGVMFSQ
jgi:hypothetical protein